MQKIFAYLCAAVLLITAPHTHTQEAPFSKDEFYKARITHIATTTTPGLLQARVVLQNGQTQTIEFGAQLLATGVRENATVIVVKNQVAGDTNWYITDIYRAPWVFVWAAAFAAITLLLGRSKGLGALTGLAISVAVVSAVLIPLILKGYNPVATTIIVGGLFSVISLYLAHGISRRTTAAVISTVCCIALAGILSYIAVATTTLTSEGSEASFFLGQIPEIAGVLDVRGLLLAGIILGVLGILDDVTTAQSAVVDELIRANPAAPTHTIFTQSMSVGREHISSLVNTLFLAYAGASLPLFLLFSSYVQPPLWVIINTQYVAEEIIRTITGSIVLICAVPIATAIAIYVLKTKKR